MTRSISRPLRRALALSAFASLAAAAPAAAQSCTLEYQRADNMWAGFGRPDGNLGVETITLAAGQTKVFVTDWKYEKQRNDGSNYYGSHLRVMTNKGQRPVRMLLRSSAISDILGSSGLIGAVFTKLSVSSGQLALSAGVRRETKADLVEVSCPTDTKI